MIVADLDDPEAVSAALAGVPSAYLVTPSSKRAQNPAQNQQERFVELAVTAGVPHLVKLSQPAADEESPVRFLRYQAAVERRIRELGIEFTFLRPNLYFRGLLALSGPIREQGVVPPPNGDARVSAVDVHDIAAVAAVALAETPTRRRHLHHHRPMVSRSASPIRIPVTAITPDNPTRHMRRSRRADRTC